MHPGLGYMLESRCIGWECSVNCNECVRSYQCFSFQIPGGILNTHSFLNINHLVGAGSICQIGRNLSKDALAGWTRRMHLVTQRWSATKSGSPLRSWGQYLLIG